MKHTDMLFSTSTAYLYLMDSTSMEDSIDGENIGLLFKHDKGIYRRRFLVLGVLFAFKCDMGVSM